MSDNPKRDRRDFPGEIDTREKRKLRARRQKGDEVWFGLGMFGMVGWSVAIPTVLCTFLGIWIDARWPQRYSWTLMLLVIGLILGCINAWFWVNRQRKGISQDRENGTS